MKFYVAAGLIILAIAAVVVLSPCQSDTPLDQSSTLASRYPIPRTVSTSSLADPSLLRSDVT